ncbi:MerR family transcriptional regulator [Paracoccus sp. 11-3]|uniref:MerR family transcriptional regulator n=2 Tax=Paracoccus amoyensis TaxID=2760093 RepID=A0A926GJH5_9RHOB|nr:MerR family transcriptional regulator [Paracoccus amoyensis]MBC9248354.1 MerR family transcriptional regulator [Paracoccus amoyensis]
MKIGELAVQTGLSNSRIRYYERIGLLKAVERMPNGYRRYLEEAVVILNLIVMAQDAGFSLEEIQSLVPDDLSRWDHELLAQALSRKIAEIEVQQAQLAASKAKLLAITDGIANRPEGLSCADNSKRVLSLVPINTFEDR